MIEIGQIDSKSRYGIVEGDVCYDKNVFEPHLILITKTIVREDPKLGDFYYGIYPDGKGCEGEMKDLKKTNKSFPEIVKLLKDFSTFQATWYDV